MHFKYCTIGLAQIKPQETYFIFLFLFFFSIHQSHILGFIRDIFDFNTSDYSSIESLCDSIVKLAKGRSEQLLRSHSYETDKPQTTSSFGTEDIIQEELFFNLGKVLAMKTVLEHHQTPHKLVI